MIQVMTAVAIANTARK